VWSLKAPEGICEFPEPEPEAAVVAVDDLVELQATAVVATTMTRPSAARRVLHDVETKVPPCHVDPCTAHLTSAAAP
jgi:hypothetical protein